MLKMGKTLRKLSIIVLFGVQNVSQPEILNIIYAILFSSQHVRPKVGQSI